MLVKYLATAGYSAQGYTFIYLTNQDVSSICTESDGYKMVIVSSINSNPTGVYGEVVAGTARKATISNGTISMGNTSAGNVYAIPLKIWGVKGELPLS